jgi:phage-related protein
MTLEQKKEGDRFLEKKHRRPADKRTEKHMKNAFRSRNLAAHLDDDELDDLGFEDDDDANYNSRFG